MWKNIIINASQIAAETDKAVLIKVPNSEYRFWHPAKLVRPKGRQYTFGYTDEFEFRLFKKGNGWKTRNQVISERTLNAKELEEYFNGNIKTFGLE